MRNVLLLASLLTLALATFVIADDAADETYQSGRSALDDGRYDEAADRFAQVMDRGGSNAAAAAYWRAYALNKAGQSTPAMEILADFRNDYPDSPWGDDVRALIADIRGDSYRGDVHHDDEIDDVKLMALQGLISVEASRALPILEKYLSDDHPRKYREMALFVLAQSSDSKAQDLLLQAARGQRGEVNQEQAIQFLGMNGDSDMVEALVSIYRSSSDPDVRRSVLQGLMMAEDSQAISQVLEGETDPELRAAAMQQLGILGDTDRLLELYRSGADLQLREQIIQALFIAEAEDALIDLAKTEQVPELRQAAIHGLALVGSETATQAMLEIYEQSSELEVKGAVLHGLFLGDDTKELIRIARQEQNPKLRSLAVQGLSRSDSEEAQNYMLELLED